MIIEKIQVGQIKPAPYNPRKDLKPGDPEYDKIRNSLKQFGYVDPLIWNKSTGHIVGGHQRFKVLLELGYKEIDCVVLELDAATERALNLALNKTGGDWDQDKLADLLKDLKDRGYNLEMTGFDAAEISQLLDPDDGEEDDFDLEGTLEEIDEPETQLGDVWILGNHRLICGDCTKIETYDKLMLGKKIDLIVTDPPYNINYEGGTKDKLKILNDNMGDDEFLQFLLASFTQMFAVAKRGCPLYVFHADLAGNQFRQAFTASGFSLRQCLIWVKNSLVLGRQDYQWRHEPILYGWKEGAGHYFVNERDYSTVFDDKIDFSSMKKEELIDMCKELYLEKFKGTTIIHENKPTKNEDHPTMKPIKLIARLVMNSSKEHDRVLDPFGGSGSTLIACEQTQRICYTSELDPKYCDVIVRRWEDLTGGRARLEGDSDEVSTAVPQ